MHEQGSDSPIAGTQMGAREQRAANATAAMGGEDRYAKLGLSAAARYVRCTD
jgi:hypothetical protein